VTSRKDSVDIIRGMALAAAGALGGPQGDAVRTEAKDDPFDPTGPVAVRVFIGERSAVFRVNGADVDHVSSDGAVRMLVERLIQEALSELVR
jgi:hypothetical protein